jgi:Domain of unknown function (DUF3459)
VGPRIDPNTVEVQRADENSMLHRVRELLGARRGLPDASADSVDWIGSGAVIAYRRGNVVVAMNSGSTATTLETPGAVVYSTKAAQRDEGWDRGSRGEPALTLAADEAVIVRLAHEQRH